MTESEALEILQQQLCLPTGFLLRLQCCEGVHGPGLQETRRALDTLEVAWKTAVEIPLRGAYLLTFLDDAIPIALYPDRQDEMWDLFLEMQERIERLVQPLGKLNDAEQQKLDTQLQQIDWWDQWVRETPSEMQPHSFDEAATIIFEHLGLGPGLLIAIRSRGALHDSGGVFKAVQLVHRALHILGQVWMYHSHIPKDLAYPLVCVHDTCTSSWGCYRTFPELQGQLQWIADTFRDHVRRCLAHADMSAILE